MSENNTKQELRGGMEVFAIMLVTSIFLCIQ